MYPPMGYRPYACHSLAHQPDAKEAVAKSDIRISRAIAPGKVTLYFGYMTIGEPNMIAVCSHSVLLTINP